MAPLKSGSGKSKNNLLKKDFASSLDRRMKKYYPQWIKNMDI